MTSSSLAAQFVTYLIQIDSPDKWQQLPLQNRETVQRDLIGSYFNSSIQSLMLILFDKVLMKFYSLVCAWNVISFVEENDRKIHHIMEKNLLAKNTKQ